MNASWHYAFFKMTSFPVYNISGEITTSTFKRQFFSYTIFGIWELMCKLMSITHKNNNCSILCAPWRTLKKSFWWQFLLSEGWQNHLMFCQNTGLKSRNSLLCMHMCACLHTCAHNHVCILEVNVTHLPQSGSTFLLRFSH